MNAGREIRRTFAYILMASGILPFTGGTAGLPAVRVLLEGRNPLVTREVRILGSLSLHHVGDEESV
jgi:hypothetical protein